MRSEIEGGRALALGIFDGVHIGHRRVIGAAVEAGERLGLIPEVLTFSALPEELLWGACPRRLTTNAERERLITGLGVRRVRELTFDRSFADMDPEDFVRLLAEKYNARFAAVGENYTFGAKAAGSSRTLKELGGFYGMEVEILPSCEREGATVSSSAIRKLVESGDIARANELLGALYAVTAEVVEGFHFGRKLGLPTLNQTPPAEKLLPAPGVYMTRTEGKRSVTNIGKNPTFARSGVTVETHILDYDGDLYGSEVRVEFLSRIRGEIKFQSAELLREQIERDVAARRAASL